MHTFLYELNYFRYLGQRKTRNEKGVVHPVDEYILSLEGTQQEIISLFHMHLKESHGLTPKLHWSIPTYYGKKLICYLNPISKGGVELAFFRGSQLSNAHSLLQSKGRKLVSGIELYDLYSLPIQPIDEIIREAITLDGLVR
ncbi:MAG: DUF1801 domain-containing protein [Bacteroidota bacterium]